MNHVVELANAWNPVTPWPARGVKVKITDAESGGDIVLYDAMEIGGLVTTPALRTITVPSGAIPFEVDISDMEFRTACGVNLTAEMGAQIEVTPINE